MSRLDLLSTAARGASSSAIRDLLEQARRPGVISLAGGIPDPDRFPSAPLAEIAAANIRQSGAHVLQYGLTAGELPLRSAIAARYPETDPDEIVVTTGSQQGLYLLGASLFDPGDVVVCGDPDYLGALQAFRSHGARLVAAPIDDEGLDIDAVAQLVQQGLRPKAVYVVPNFHNPTGSTLSAERRVQLHRLAEAHNFVVIEDDPYRDLAYDGEADPLGPVAPMVVQLGSTSKVLAPGLRVGWMVGDRWLLDAVEIAKQAADLHTSTLTQAIAADALVSGWFGPHVEGLRDHYRTKRDALAGALRAQLSDRVAFSTPAGGMFLWAQREPGVDTSALLQISLDEGVAFVPGAAFAVEANLDRWFRLSFATADVDDIPEAVARIGRSLDLHTTDRRSR